MCTAHEILQWSGIQSYILQLPDRHIYSQVTSHLGCWNVGVVFLRNLVLFEQKMSTILLLISQSSVRIEKGLIWLLIVVKYVNQSDEMKT